MRRLICLSSLYIMAMSLSAEEASDQPIRLGVRYTTSEGIGYKTGYSTLESFISGMIRENWVPFLDLRGHVFDNGKWAANGGFGLRYLTSSRAWGANAYYDYRNTKHQQYNQVAAGFESLGSIWDFRLNGYLPVGKTKSSLRQTRFDRFENHYMYLKSTRDIAFKGVNAEAGVHIDGYQPALFYVAAGPYYLHGNGETAWGGQLRGSVEVFKRYLRLEGNLSYDSFFHWAGQGQIGINIPLGRKMERTRPSRDNSVYARAVQRVDRHEIIPVGKQHKKSLAINPATGEPYFFIFVDNTSSSLGTFESPYHLLSDAQAHSLPNQVIYVFPGTGTSQYMDSGITLKAGQRFLGSSTVQPIPTTMGTVSIPAFTSALPVITSTTDTPVIALSNNNLVSGFYIENINGIGINGTGITNFTAEHNHIIGGQSLFGGSGQGILLTNISGQVEVNNNLFVQTCLNGSLNDCVTISLTEGECSANFSNNAFYGYDNMGGGISGIDVQLSNNSSMGTFTVSNSFLQLEGSSSNAVNITLLNDSFLTNFIVSNTQSVGQGLTTSLSGSGSISNVNVDGFNCLNGPSAFTFNLSSTGGIGNVKITNSYFMGQQNPAVYANLSSTANIENFELSNSVIDKNGSYAVYMGFNSTGVARNITVSNCNIKNIGSYGFEVYMGSTGAPDQIILSNTSFENSYTGAIIYAGGVDSLDLIQVTGCTFNGCSSSGLSLQGPIVAQLEVSGSSFVACEQGCVITTDSQILSGTLSGNTFDACNTNGINITTSTANNVLSLTNNTFANLLSPIVGYGTKVTNDGGALCLDFFGNNAYPLDQGGGINPYYFNNTAGTFNLTERSTSANNAGTITSSGISGSCSQ